MNQKKFGLIGRNITYSFSKSYFTKKFDALELSDCCYVNFDLKNISQVAAVFEQPCLKGCNVTTPYKEKIIDFMDEMDSVAQKIGAVNTIAFLKDGKKKGYNTDAYGFEKSLFPLLKPHHKKALLLGTGGASKAIAYALERLGIFYTFVSRKDQKGQLTYAALDQNVISEYTLIINCSPLGTNPDTEKCPEIPYHFLTQNHLLYDLIYNPSETLFLKKGKQNSAIIKNGLEMLALQAEQSWNIWNNNL